VRSSARTTEGRVVLAGRSSRDPEFITVARILRRASIPFVRIDAEDIAGTPCAVDPAAGAVTWKGVTFVPTVTWIRHFSMRAGSTQQHGAAALLRSDSWEALVSQLSAVSRTTIGCGAPGQIQQLRDAAGLGIRIPRTIVTSDPKAVSGLLRTDHVVVKVLDLHYIEHKPGELSWFHPRVMPASRVHDYLGARFDDIPVVVQEYVRHDSELRLYLVGGHAFAFRVKKNSPSDIWVDPDGVSVAPAVPCPAALRASRQLAEKWNLSYGAYDFLLDENGPVFLEANAHGDWRWYERKASSDSVSTLAGRMVASLHRSATGKEPRLDLLALLGASYPTG
jgi:hypothetical protein